MKNLFTGAVLLLLVVFAAPAFAGFTGPGSAPSATTVKAILDKPVDDMPVTLTGNIIKKISHKKYLFRDATGEINLEIDKDIFPQTEITPQVKVEVSGEVEKEFFKAPAVDVKSLKTVQ